MNTKNLKVVLTKEQEIQFQECGGEGSYNRECFAHWSNLDGTPKQDGYTGNDEYGNGCYGPSEARCPICN
jgi:hypothetical protein